MKGIKACSSYSRNLKLKSPIWLLDKFIMLMGLNGKYLR